MTRLMFLVRMNLHYFRPHGKQHFAYDCHNTQSSDVVCNLSDIALVEGRLALATRDLCQARVLPVARAFSDWRRGLFDWGSHGSALS